MINFNNLVTVLKENGYNVEVEEKHIYIAAFITGKNIFGCFCALHDGDNLAYASNDWLNGNIVADHNDCFDKWSKCPLKLEIPKTASQIDFVLQQLEYWGSQEGYENSDQYNFDTWIEKYPKSMI